MLGTLRDPRAVAPLVSVLRDGDRAVRDAAIGALLAIGEPAVTTLGACLSDPVLTVQELASSVLATIADARVLAPLVKALASPDWIVRMHAAKALGRIQDPGAVAPLVPLLQDTVKAVREETSTALAAIGEAALSSLLAALTHAEWLVRLHAVEALGKTRSPEAVDPSVVGALQRSGQGGSRGRSPRAWSDRRCARGGVPRDGDERAGAAAAGG